MDSDELRLHVRSVSKITIQHLINHIQSVAEKFEKEKNIPKESFFNITMDTIIRSLFLTHSSFFENPGIYVDRVYEEIKKHIPVAKEVYEEYKNQESQY